jgi:outer membrane protein
LVLAVFGAPGASAQQAAPAITLIDSVRQALAHNPSIQLSARQLDVAQGQLQLARGAFDTVLSASTQKLRSIAGPAATDVYSGPDANSGNLNQSYSSAGASQLLRNGISIAPQLLVSKNKAVPAAGIPESDQTTLAFSLTIPLMKNYGADVYAAGEATALREVDAARLDLTQAISRVTLDVVSAYWSYLAAEQFRRFARDAEASAAERARDIDQLVQAQLLPAAERELLGADEADKRAQSLAAEQTLADSRSALAKLMGLSAAQARALPTPGEDFPAASQDNAMARLDLIKKQALSKRADVQAAQIRYDASARALSALRKNLKPQLDLTVSAGYSRLTESSVSAGASSATLSRNGPSASVMLSYQFPVQNNTVGGQLVQKQAALEQQEIVLRDLRTAALTDIDTQMAALQRLALRLGEADKAVKLYEKSLSNEAMRHKLGQGTVMDILNVSERLLQAQQNLTTARLRYAIAIAQLRHSSGTLLKMRTQNDATVEHDSLVTAP